MKPVKYPLDRNCRIVNLRLRRTSSRSVLHPAAAPSKICNSGLSPLLRADFGGTGSTFFRRNNTLYVAIGSDAPSPLKELDSEPLAAAKVSENDALIATGSELLHAANSGSAWNIVSHAEFPPVRFAVARDVSLVRADIAPRKFSDTDSSTQTVPGADDIKRLSNDLASAYSGIMNSATRTGKLVQPVLARYCLFNKHDALLFVSPPVLLAAPDVSFQLTDTISIPISTDGTKRSGFNVQAAAYRAECIIPAHAPCPDVAYMTVELSSQLDPVDCGQTPVCHIQNDPSGGKCISCRMPGVSDTTDLNRLVRNAIENINSIFMTVARFENPFDNGESKSFAINHVSGGKSATSACPVADSELFIPHAFSAGSIAVNGGQILFGNISRRRFKGYDIIMCTAETGSSDWAAAVAVSFRDGEERVVQYSEGSSSNPLSLNPLLSYPSRDAVQMTVYLRCGAASYRRSFPLKAAVGARIAYYLADDLMPISFSGHESEIFIIPAENVVNRRFPGTLISADLSAPHLPVDIAGVTNSAITHVCNAVGANSGWEQTRSRFYIFTAEQVLAASFGKSLTLGNINAIDNSGISCRSQAVAVSGKGIYYLHRNRLLLLRGVKCAEITATDANLLAYDSSRGELWLVGPEIWVMQTEHNCFYLRDFGESVSDTLDNLVTTDSGVYDICRDSVGQMINIEYRERFPASDASRTRLDVKAKRIPALRSCFVDMAAAAVDPLSISILGDHGAGPDHSPSLFCHSYTGAINSPILNHTPAAICDGYFVHIAGNVSPDSEFRNINISFDQ